MYVRKDTRKIARKIMIAVAILLISTILLASVSFAWISLSKVPEVSGIVTYIGSNGSLEIALLTDDTYINPFLIRTSVGNSAVLVDATQANIAWGNILDLSDSSYGLDQISILPSRLNVRSGMDGYNIVGDNMLVFPEYGIDGRLQDLHTNTVSATYAESSFLYSTRRQGYGVRGIGTVTNVSAQQSALASARSIVKSCISSSSAATKAMWNEDGGALLQMYISHYVKGNETFGRSDVSAIKQAATKMLAAVSYIDIALRQSVIGYAASEITEEADFKTIRSAVENTMIPLSTIVSSASTVSLPSKMLSRVKTIEDDKIELQKIIYDCDKLKGDIFTWNQLSPLLNQLLVPDEIYLAEQKLSNLSSSTVIRSDNRVTLSPKAGSTADVADFSGNYNVIFQSSDDVNFEAVSTSKVSPAYLMDFSEALEKLEAADTGGQIDSATLNDVYGYAVDMAFRCNEPSDLLLQTFPEDRLLDESGLAMNQGAGSFMRFSSEQLDTDKIIKMMDAIRVGFIDNQNNLLAVAKLGVTAYTESDEGVSAPLYLYDYSVSSDGVITVGERRKPQSPITNLQKSVPTIITVVVWLDGDHVDNNLSAISAKSITGSFNLQFSSTATLNPADIPLQPKG